MRTPTKKQKSAVGAFGSLFGTAVVYFSRKAHDPKIAECIALAAPPISVIVTGLTAFAVNEFMDSFAFNKKSKTMRKEIAQIEYLHNNGAIDDNEAKELMRKAGAKVIPSINRIDGILRKKSLKT
jgi:hypothetical protein